jgi:hypothetical protein
MLTQSSVEQMRVRSCGNTVAIVHSLRRGDRGRRREVPMSSIHLQMLNLVGMLEHRLKSIERDYVVVGYVSPDIYRVMQR